MEAPARKQRELTSGNVKHESSAARIVDKFGGLTRFCELCDFPVSTVWKWTTTGVVPSRQRDGMSYQAWIILRGRDNGIEIAPAEFIDMPESAE